MNDEYELLRALARREKKNKIGVVQECDATGMIVAAQLVT